jgi:DNA modification methylase
MSKVKSEPLNKFSGFKLLYKSIDLVLTDPPYRIHADSGGGLHKSRDWLKKVHDSNLDNFDPKFF